MVKSNKLNPTHVCTQAEQIEKMSLLLVGNGHPEDGIAFKVLVMAKDFPELHKDIEEIKRIVTNLSESKIETDAYEEGERDTKLKVESRKKEEADKKDMQLKNRNTTIMYGSLLIAFLLFALQVANYIKSDKILKAENAKKSVQTEITK